MFASRTINRRARGIRPFDAKAEHCQTNGLRSYPASAIKDPLAVGGNWQEAGKHIALAHNCSVPIIEDKVIALGQFIVKTIVHSTQPGRWGSWHRRNTLADVMNISWLGWSATLANGPSRRSLRRINAEAISGTAEIRG